MSGPKPSKAPEGGLDPREWVPPTTAQRLMGLGPKSFWEVVNEVGGLDVYEPLPGKYRIGVASIESYIEARRIRAHGSASPMPFQGQQTPSAQPGLRGSA